MLTDTHCLDLLLLQNLFCNISYVCCSITLTFRIYCDLYRCWLLLQSLWCCVFGCFLFCQQVSKQIVFFFFFFVVCFFLGGFFFSLPLSLYPPFSFFLSLSSPSCWLSPQPFFYLFLFFPFFFLLSLSCFLCPLVLSVTVWLSKMVYKIKLIN